MNPWLDEISYRIIRRLGGWLQHMDEEKALRWGRRVGRLLYPLSGRRRIAYADLKAVFGSQYTAQDRWRIVRHHYEHLGQMGVELMRLPVFDKRAMERRVRVRNFERYAETAQHQGAILLTAHLGNWELAQVLSALHGKPLHVLARSQKYRRLNHYLNTLRESHGSRVISRGIGIRDILRALRRKEVVGMLGDQDAGKTGGLIVRFLGRKTTMPTGAFELARRADVPVLPCFIVRTADGCHEVHIEERWDSPQGGRADSLESLRPAVEYYTRLLEKHICDYPEQWLWAAKRWKYCWTKHLVVLSDGKAGHEKQAQAVVEQFKKIHSQYGREGMEYFSKKIEVRFRSKWHRRIFPWFAFFFYPWVQGRLGILRHFLVKESAEQLEQTYADFVISAGASLVPINVLMARECQAKSIVLMKPSFPFNLFHFDLAIIGRHDTGLVPSETFRTLLTLSPITEETLEEDARKLCRFLRNPEKVKRSVFLGGPTRHYRMDVGGVKELVKILESSSAYGDYLITTSRRTPLEVVRFLKNHVARSEHCQLLTVASENNPPETVGGMMGLSEILIVTADSISMISEAVRSGKKVIVLELTTEDLPGKHRRFKEILEREEAVILANLGNLREKFTEAAARSGGRHIAKKEETALMGRLEKIL